MDDLIHTPKYKDLIYDVGMHRGEDTEFYLRKGFRVVAFEADPELLRLCINQLREFVDRDQLIIVPGKAIVTRDVTEAGQKKVRFYKNDDVSVWGTISADRAQMVGATWTSRYLS